MNKHWHPESFSESILLAELISQGSAQLAPGQAGYRFKGGKQRGYRFYRGRGGELPQKCRRHATGMPLASCPSTNKGVVFSQNAIVWHQIWCVHARWWTGTTGQKFMKTYVIESCAELFSELAGTVPAGCQLSWHRHFAHISFHTFLHKMYLHCKRLHTEKKQFHNVLFSAFYSNLKTTRPLRSRKIGFFCFSRCDSTT